MAVPGAVLIGFQEQGNLGIGYLGSTLTKFGFEVQILDFRQERASILEAIHAAKPELVGFSLIFQYYVPQFRELASYLRGHGVACHFTAGGHFPSLRYQHVLQVVPQLDSIVRFEGEITLLELMQCLAEHRDWHGVEGIAYRDSDQYVANPPRPLIEDLDELPFPVRPLESSLVVLGKKVAPILGSRGCSRDCSFCSIRQFYGQSPGRKVRVRQPAKVVEEMKALYDKKGVSIFLFQDDDFPVWGAFGRRWTGQFIESLRGQGLDGRVIWKISCRCDEVEPELFSRLRDAGLYTVYLGMESGNAAGLRTLNKGETTDQGLRAISILRELGLACMYGFMLFDPSSTIELVRENVAYLRQITADGKVPASFGRMLPYAGTAIELSLAKEGRLRGSVENPEYDFLDRRVNSYLDVLAPLLGHWMDGSNALVNHLNSAWQECWVLRRLFPPLSGQEGYESSLRFLTGRGNDYILNLVEQVGLALQNHAGGIPSLEDVKSETASLSAEILAGRNAFIAKNAEAILDSLQATNFAAAT